MWEFNEIKNWKQEEVPRNCRGKSDKSAMWVRTKINRKACEFVYVKLMELFIEFGINIITSHLQQVTIWIWKPLTKPEKKSFWQNLQFDDWINNVNGRFSLSPSHSVFFVDIHEIIRDAG